jgi:hypothetical protein
MVDRKADRGLCLLVRAAPSSVQRPGWAEMPVITTNQLVTLGFTLGQDKHAEKSGVAKQESLQTVVLR